MGITSNISFYSSIGSEELSSTKTIPLDIFLDNIKDGVYQDAVLAIRTISNKKAREEAKKRLPAVTIAGQFKHRDDNSIIQHSGFLAMDFDNLKDPEGFKDIIAEDYYCYSAFISVSGNGVCALFRVQADKHKEAFQGLSEYLFKKYGEPCDSTSINPSRLRFVTYDPGIHIKADLPPKFTQYPKNKPPKKIDKAIFAEDDFKHVLDQIVARRLNLVENYHEWLRVAFAFSDKFQEQGREYFHIVSQYSTKYDPAACDKQYSICLKHKGTAVATIAMFYYYAKQAGLEIYSERTRKIAYSAIQGKRSGLNAEQVVQNLDKFEGITNCADIVQQVMNDNIELNDDTLLDQLEIYIRQNYSLRKNAITRYLENNGVPLEQEHLNSIFIKAKKIFESLSFELMERLIRSDFVPQYNPFIDFINEHKGEDLGEGHIDKLFSSIENVDPDYAMYFGKKWFVGIISTMMGEHSPLLLALCGDKHGTGKTEFFRRLLPEELKKYYGESKLDAGKDDEILMTQKLILMDDELGGKSKKDSRKLKDILSKNMFSLREPYGRANVDLKRLAVLCGTTNEPEILTDTTGNRRIIPIIVHGINKGIYNSVDKTAMLMEAYKLWESGFQWQILNDSDVAYLRQDESWFEANNAEADLIRKYYEPGEEEMTATDIKVELESITRQKLILDRIGKELKKLGFKQIHRKKGRFYLVQRTPDFPIRNSIPF